MEEWIASRLPYVKSFWIKTMRDDTQDLITRIRWPDWSADQLQRVGSIEIWRHAIMQLPPWIFKMPQLKHITIQEMSQKYRNSNLPPLIIPKILAENINLEKLSILYGAFSLDPEFCRLNRIKKLDLDLSNIQSLLEDLGLFSHLKQVDLFSSHLPPSFAFLSTWTKVRKLTLRTYLDHLPDEIRFMVALQDLHLEDNPLTDLPAWIADLSMLQSLTLGDPARPKDILITEYPAVLRACSALLYCDLGIPAHSLYGLPPIARYWGVLLWTYQTEGSHAFDLPESIKKAIVDELSPTFSFDYGSGEGAAGVAHWYRMQRHQAPNHPQLVAFLDAYYAESYDVLFNRVCNGEKLTDTERERFVHETTHKYYQLLCNTARSTGQFHRAGCSRAEIFSATQRYNPNLVVNNT